VRGTNHLTSPRAQHRLLAGAFALVAATLPLARTFPFPGVSVADLALALAAAIAAGAWVRERSLPRPPGWALPAAALLAWSAAGGVCLAALGSPLPFSFEELLKSLAKLGFYVLAATALSSVVGRLGGHAWREIVLWVLAIHALVALYVYCAMNTDLLPPRELWAAIGTSEESANAARFGIFTVRLRGVAAEPANMGYFLALGLGAVLLSGAWPRRRPWRELVTVAALVLTLSLSAYALAGGGALLVLIARRRSMTSLLRGLAAAAALALVMLTLVPPARQAFDVAVIERVAGIVAGSANPAETKRLVGSWTAAGMMVQASPWLGVGLGNYDVALGELIPRMDPRLGMRPQDQGWSVPTYVLGTLGWPGLFLLALLYLAVLRASWAGGLLFGLAAFADGTLLGPTYWVFLVLLAVGEPVARRVTLADSASTGTSSTAATGPSDA
jgi:hypothetical protein